MKMFMDTDIDESGDTIIQLQDIKVSPEKTMLFLQEFVKLYKNVEATK
ncbi:MAG: hypothetical protein GY853_02200 [PVC group bacterium]|nr:hypothetical protein [PVC group bacterium]